MKIKTAQEASSTKELVEVIQKEMGDKEYATLETCPIDSVGWSAKTHAFMEKIQRQGLIPDCHVSVKLKFEVYDWTITTND